MSSISKENLEKLVECGITYAQFKAIVRENAPSDLNPEDLKGSVPVVVPEVHQIKSKDVYACKRSYEKQRIRLDSHVWKSLEMYKEKIVSGGGNSILEMIPEADNLSERCFIFTISTRLQF